MESDLVKALTKQGFAITTMRESTDRPTDRLGDSTLRGPKNQATTRTSAAHDKHTMKEDMLEFLEKFHDRILKARQKSRDNKQEIAYGTVCAIELQQ